MKIVSALVGLFLGALLGLGTALAAAGIVGPGSAAYEVIRDLVNHLPLMLTPIWVQSKSAPIGPSASR